MPHSSKAMMLMPDRLTSSPFRSEVHSNNFDPESSRINRLRAMGAPGSMATYAQPTFKMARIDKYASGHLSKQMEIKPPGDAPLFFKALAYLLEKSFSSLYVQLCFASPQSGDLETNSRATFEGRSRALISTNSCRNWTGDGIFASLAGATEMAAGFAPEKSKQHESGE